MRELIRLQNVRCDLEEGHNLTDYSLTVFAGEIIYIQGVSGSGKGAVERVLTGQTAINGGRLYIDEQICDVHTPEQAFTKGIYTIGFMNPMADKMTVTDNLEAVKYVKHPLHYFPQRTARKKTAEMLVKLGIAAKPDTQVRNLSFLEEQILCMAKVIRNGARLVIVNCVYNVYSSQDAKVLRDYMKSFAAAGISFLVISERPNPFLEAAHKVQILHRGLDLRIWNTGDYDRKRLYDYIEKNSSREQGKKDNASPPGIAAVYILDYHWSSRESVFSFFRQFQIHNPQIWEKCISIRVPPEDVYFDGETAVIPQNSAKCLMVNLSIGDNLIMCIPKRIGISGLRIIHRNMKQFVENDFRKQLRISDSVQELQELNKVQKKILSIYRWVLAHPQNLILENPFWGMDMDEVQQLSDYLYSLKSRGIKILLYSKFMEDVEQCQDIILTSVSARNAEIAK